MPTDVVLRKSCPSACKHVFWSICTLIYCSIRLLNLGTCPLAISVHWHERVFSHGSACTKSAQPLVQSSHTPSVGIHVISRFWKRIEWRGHSIHSPLFAVLWRRVVAVIEWDLFMFACVSTHGTMLASLISKQMFTAIYTSAKTTNHTSLLGLFKHIDNKHMRVHAHKR